MEDKLENPYSMKNVWAILLVLAPMPLVLSTPLATEILIYAIFAMGFNLALGHTGILSFGHAAYFGLGCYITGMALRYLELGVFPALLLGTVAAGLAALALAALAVKRQGVYFAMISLAFSQMLYFLALSPLKGLTGGEDGLKFIPKLAIEFPVTMDLSRPWSAYWFTLLFFALALFAMRQVLNSPMGRLLPAVRENEARVKSLGFPSHALKIMSMAISGLFCGLAGGLLTVYLGYVPLSTLHWFTSGSIMMMTILGGMQSFSGPIVGVLVFLCLQDVTGNFTERWELFSGTLFMALILLFPQGVAGSIKERFQHRMTPTIPERQA
ncbi:branched-chain amino acid ABC transporter permease [Desulfatibacillum aliphaticivorans]|uniref:branched-chain amino acid ABC transporter permease n=1 Tax=Desulfatibacillum aliphaticivorans TaxID=218208 RepID=UPI000410D86B|nr:branched-chain amino acid ABC transporter permease [Desulfatibacillum aliphaticivorans]